MTTLGAEHQFSTALQRKLITAGSASICSTGQPAEIHKVSLSIESNGTTQRTPAVNSKPLSVTTPANPRKANVEMRQFEPVANKTMVP